MTHGVGGADLILIVSRLALGSTLRPRRVWTIGNACICLCMWTEFISTAILHAMSLKVVPIAQFIRKAYPSNDSKTGELNRNRTNNSTVASSRVWKLYNLD